MIDSIEAVTHAALTLRDRLATIDSGETLRSKEPTQFWTVRTNRRTTFKDAKHIAKHGIHILNEVANFLTDLDRGAAVLRQNKVAAPCEKCQRPTHLAIYIAGRNGDGFAAWCGCPN